MLTLGQDMVATHLLSHGHFIRQSGSKFKHKLGSGKTHPFLRSKWKLMATLGRRVTLLWPLAGCSCPRRWLNTHAHVGSTNLAQGSLTESSHKLTQLGTWFSGQLKSTSFTFDLDSGSLIPVVLRAVLTVSIYPYMYACVCNSEHIWCVCYACRMYIYSHYLHIHTSACINTVSK